MVELLMAAFILAIGILGLTSLQVMSLRFRGGSQSVNNAVLVGERVLDQAEALGRNTLLRCRSGETPATPSSTYFGINYFGTGPFTLYFDFKGQSRASADYYTVTVTPSTLTTPVAGLGGMALMTVQVAWTEAVAGGGTTAKNVTLTRRVAYATS